MENNASETIALGGGEIDQSIYDSEETDPLQDAPTRPGRRGASGGEVGASGEEAQDRQEKFEATEERTAIYRKIQRYKEVFPDSCRLVDASSLAYMDDESLGQYLSDVQFAVSSRRGTSLVGKSVDLAIVGAEVMGKQFYPQLEGLHQDLSINDEYQDLLKELSIEYSNFGYIPPEWRLIMLVGGAAAARIVTSPAVPKKVNSESTDFISDEKRAKYDSL